MLEDAEDWCLWCGEDLPGDRHPLRVYCSRECKTACNNRVQTERRRERAMNRQQCKGCRSKLSPERHALEIFCSRSCRQAYEQRARVRRRHATTLKPRRCITCGDTFKPGRKDNVACSKTCQKTHWLARQGPDYDRRELERKRELTAAKRGAQPPKPCAWCGAEFKPEGRKGRMELWCSNSCAKRAWRDRIKVPPETRTCERCGVGFQVKPSSKRRFCSQACGRQANRLPRTPSRCEHCGWTFTPKRLRKDRVVRFCSRGCAWRAWRTSR